MSSQEQDRLKSLLSPVGWHTRQNSKCLPASVLIGWILSNNSLPNSYKYPETDSGDSSAVMEHSGEDHDKFLRDVTMTGRRAIFCSESLTMPHLVTSRCTNNKRRRPEGTLTDWRVEECKRTSRIVRFLVR